MEDEIKTEVKDMNLRDIAQGYIRFSIKAEDTLENLQTHSAFKEFCRIETDNNYTLGIRKLMEYYQGDFKIEMLYNKIEETNILLADLRSSVISLSSETKEEKDEESDAF